MTRNQRITAGGQIRRKEQTRSEPEEKRGGQAQEQEQSQGTAPRMSRRTLGPRPRTEASGSWTEEYGNTWTGTAENGQERIHAQAGKRTAQGQETRDQAQKRQEKDAVRMKSPEEERTRLEPEEIMDKRRRRPKGRSLSTYRRRSTQVPTQRKLQAQKCQERRDKDQDKVEKPWTEDTDGPEDTEARM